MNAISLVSPLRVSVRRPVPGDAVGGHHPVEVGDLGLVPHLLEPVRTGRGRAEVVHHPTEDEAVAGDRVGRGGALQRRQGVEARRGRWLRLRHGRRPQPGAHGQAEGAGDHPAEPAPRQGPREHGPGRANGGRRVRRAEEPPASAATT